MPGFPRFRISDIYEQTTVAQVVYESTMDSTSDRARRLVEESERRNESLETPLLVLADRQTAGRGRGENAWWSGSGALTFSLVLREPLGQMPLSDWPKLSITTALAVLETLAADVSPRRLELRWPNDVYADGRKIAGILPEVVSRKSGALLVLGIGLNVNNRRDSAPEPLRREITSWADLTGRTADTTGVLIRLLEAIRHQFARLASRDPMLVDEWNQWLRLHGRQLSLESAGQRFTGTCSGIDSAGRLLLQVGSQLRPFHSAVNVRPID